MKVMIILFSLLFSFAAWSQDEEAAPEQQDAFQDQYVEETAPEDNVYTNDAVQAEEIAAPRRGQTDSDKIQVECVCPDNNVQQEVVTTETVTETTSAPSIFPPGTAVNITPVPTDENPAKVQVKERDFPPAYVEKLPAGYSNSTFQPIGTYGQ